MSDAQVALKLRIGKALADKSEVAAHQVTQAGRIGAKSGEVSELTVIVPLKAGGAERLRRFFKLIDGNLHGASQVGTLHNMRFVFLDNDTKLLFATAYDGEWDPYIDDFATQIPEMMDYIFGNIEGWPGIHSPAVKDFIAQYQIPAGAWFVAHPALSSHIRRMNPRDTKLAVLSDVNIRRIIRRSTTYGTPLAKDTLTDDGKPRGLDFIAIGARAIDTVEFLQSEWINSGNFISQGKEKDPMLGIQDKDAYFTVPGSPPRRVCGIETFNTLQGGEYFFMPSLRALQWIGDLSSMVS